VSSEKLITSHTTEAWVDDSNDYINDFLADFPWDEQELCERLQQQNQEWEQLLSASGGKLELPKCLAYIVVYEFVNGKPKQWTKEDMTAQLFITDTESQIQTQIDIKDPAESHKTLGTHQNPAGNPIGQAKTMSIKKDRMQRAFRYMNLPKYKVHLAYSVMYTKSLQFPLGVTLMSYELAHQISKRTVKSIIRAMKVNGSSPRVLAFAPKELMGLGLCHHYTAQGKEHLKQIVQHVRQQDENGKLYNMIFDHAQLLAGTQFPIMQNPTRRLPHVTEPFIVAIRKFLTQCNMNIVITDLYIPSPLRVNDVNLINAAMGIETNNKAICRFNQVRIYLQVTWLSEICDATGTRILPEFLAHTDRTEIHSKSMLPWPVQGLPPRKSWIQWKYLLRKRFLESKNGVLANNTLEQKMGPFFPTSLKHRRWKWELTDQSTIVENLFAFENRQRKYKVMETRNARNCLTIKKDEFEWLQTDQDISGYPIDQIRQSAMTLTLTKPTCTTVLNLQQTTIPVTPKFITKLIQFSDTRELTDWEKDNLCRTRMIIAIVSKQWGERTDFGWSVCYKRGNERPFFGGGAGTVMKTTSFSEKILGELYATRAALTTLRRVLQSVWTKQPLKFTVISANESTMVTLGKLWRVSTHNPRWRLNRNWELLNGIATDLSNQPLRIKMAIENDERHNQSLKEADRRVERYQESHPKKYQDFSHRNCWEEHTYGKVMRLSTNSTTKQSSWGTSGPSSADT
jgi:hypothetical protein